MECGSPRCECIYILQRFQSPPWILRTRHQGGNLRAGARGHARGRADGTRGTLDPHMKITPFVFKAYLNGHLPRLRHDPHPARTVALVALERSELPSPRRSNILTLPDDVISSS